jgi:hypothetical protein
MRHYEGHRVGLVLGEAVDVDNFGLEIGEVGIVEVELPLEGPIRHPATALEHLEHLLEDLIKRHEQPSLPLGCSVASAVCKRSCGNPSPLSIYQRHGLRPFPA